MASFLLLIYKFLSIIFTPVVIIIVLLRVLQGKEISSRIKERFGFSSIKRPNGKLIWINASSIGEYLATISLIKKIRKIKPKTKILLTTNTKTSALLAKKITDKNIIHQFTPQDNILVIKKFLNYWKPSLVLWMESELWPIILDETKKNGLKMILLNGRMSDKSFNNWSYFKLFFKKIISNFDLILTMSKFDRNNFKKLGAKNLDFIGNLKFSNEIQNHNKLLEKKIKKIIFNRPVWLAASTHIGEEMFAANLHSKLKRNLNLKNLLTIIVPRNVKRSSGIKKKIKSIIVNTKKLKENLVNKNTEIIIDDSIGQLEIWYKNVKTVFLGKSYPPKGGQNPIEPAKNGCVIISGKMSNFKEIEEEMLARKSLIISNNFSGFYNKIKDSILEKKYTKKIGINAKKFVKSKDFVLDKTINKIRKYLV
ncbi:MAG: 3-deoxy-D-manno-octulosonic acid transferase [Alphaproteobacteria bacterium MarineAlpha6_Bin4]|nr:MAG: 3-deoxy-D-manno-octulosonic acid transferase [Alphaproteobacteria bacterium MarineAlpha6_Bin4]